MCGQVRQLRRATVVVDSLTDGRHMHASTSAFVACLQLPTQLTLRCMPAAETAAANTLALKNKRAGVRPSCVCVAA